MGFDLARGKKCFSFNNQTWWDVLRLAVGCGWEPTGTGPPRGVPANNWSGSYYSNDGQRMYARDAKRLADILQKVVAAPTASSLDFDPSRISRWLRTPGGKEALLVSGGFEEIARVFNDPETGEKRKTRSRNLPWILSKNGKSCLRDFIEFCRGGSFRIY